MLKAIRVCKRNLKRGGIFSFFVGDNSSIRVFASDIENDLVADW